MKNTKQLTIVIAILGILIVILVIANVALSLNRNNNNKPVNELAFLGDDLSCVSDEYYGRTGCIEEYYANGGNKTTALKAYDKLIDSAKNANQMSELIDLLIARAGFLVHEGQYNEALRSLEQVDISQADNDKQAELYLYGFGIDLEYNNGAESTLWWNRKMNVTKEVQNGKGG